MKPFEALTVLAENDFIDGSCMHVSFAKELANLKDTSLSSGSDRSWIYQTCTEFGFYQTCDPETECVFCSKPHLNTLDSYYYLCRKAFGISGDVTEERIRYSNLYYGGNRTDATRIFYVNGQVDPWRSQSVQTSSNPELPALMVPGASHHFWTHPEKESDSMAVVEARTEIRNQIDKWLAEPYETAGRMFTGVIQ